jgi:tetratricopeptide (TPR) repeat protein
MKQSLVLLSVFSVAVFSANSAFAAKTEKTPEQEATRVARDLLESGQTDAAETKVRSILREHPADTDAKYVYASILYKLGRYHFAADQLKDVLAQQPQNPEANLLIGQIYQSMHKPVLAITAYKRFQTLAPNDPRSQQYAALIAVLQDEAKKQEQHHVDLDKDTGNYLAAVCQGSFLRWKNPAAISVLVLDGSKVPGYRPEFEESLRQAFDEWTETTDGKIGFVFTQDPKQAQLTVQWTDDLHAPALTAEAGITKTSPGKEGIEKAEIALLTVDNFKDGPVGKNFMYNVCLHEIGHALGLQGHRPQSEDIMHPTLYLQQGLSGRDKRTILALYSDAADNAKPMPYVDEWGRPLPPAKKAERLAREGGTALGAGDLQLAIDKFEEALKLDAKAPTAKENLSTALNNLAISKDTAPDKVLDLLRLALYVNPENKIAQTNLNSFLRSKGYDPTSFDVRSKLAQECISKHNFKGAIVEYRTALAIKGDPETHKKLQALEAASK